MRLDIRQSNLKIQRNDKQARKESRRESLKEGEEEGGREGEKEWEEEEEGYQGLFINSFLSPCKAEEEGLLLIGDELISINKFNIEGFSLQQLLEVIKQVDDVNKTHILLGIRRPIQKSTLESDNQVCQLLSLFIPILLFSFYFILLILFFF